MKHPIENIEWLHCSELTANDYNPNVVLNQEMALLKFSLLKQGWVQPILVTADHQIIDGFHRWWLTGNDKDVAAMSGGAVPCAVLELSEAERMLLTIRINRAKGNHVAFKMHELVSTLYNELGVDKATIAAEIGANTHEIDLLLQADVFAAKNIKEHKYSKAWIPVKKLENAKA